VRVMTYTVLIVLQGYREWTESLGSDREWLIQLVQSRLYEVLQSLCKDFDGIAIPLRYDILLSLLPPDVDIEEFSDIVRKSLSKYSPTPITIKACCGGLPEVINVCSKDLDIDTIARCEEYEALVVAHADLNYFTETTIKDGVLNAYMGVLRYVSRILDLIGNKALIQYLGGDNVVALTSLKYLDEVIKAMTSFKNVKVGVGISLKPREAFMKAAQALSVLRREGRVRSFYIVK